MSFMLRLAILVLSLGPLGCLGALQKHNETRRTERRAEGIAAACKEKDAAKLEEFLKYEPDRANHAAATSCLVDLRVTALVSADCATFSSAFADRDRHMEGKVEVSKRKQLIDFQRHLFAEPEPDRERHFGAIADKAWACHDNTVLFTDASNALMKNGADTWNPLYARLEKKGGAGSVLERMLEVMRADDLPMTPDAARMAGWLGKVKPVDRCKDLEEASRGKSGMRHDLLHFFLQNDCKSEAASIATEQLTSKDAGARMDACLAFGRLKDKTRVAEMRRLATTDTARSLDRERVGYLTYAYVTFPVREACQQTLNELELGR